MIGGVSARPLAAADCSRCGESGSLTRDEQAQVRELAARDREVRAHEQAHRAAAGPYASGASFTYTTGPDGRRYATDGSVSIDASPVANDPRGTIRKAQIVQRAATAPAEPSAQDLRVAAEAAAMLAKARQDLASESDDSEPDANDPARAHAAETYAATGTPPVDRVDRTA